MFMLYCKNNKKKKKKWENIDFNGVMLANCDNYNRVDGVFIF